MFSIFPRWTSFNILLFCSFDGLSHIKPYQTANMLLRSNAYSYFKALNEGLCYYHSHLPSEATFDPCWGNNLVICYWALWSCLGERSNSSCHVFRSDFRFHFLRCRGALWAPMAVWLHYKLCHSIKLPFSCHWGCFWDWLHLYQRISIKLCWFICWWSLHGAARGSLVWHIVTGALLETER